MLERDKVPKHTASAAPRRRRLGHAESGPMPASPTSPGRHIAHTRNTSLLRQRSAWWMYRWGRWSDPSGTSTGGRLARGAAPVGWREPGGEAVEEEAEAESELLVG